MGDRPPEHLRKTLIDRATFAMVGLGVGYALAVAGAYLLWAVGGALLAGGLLAIAIAVLVGWEA